MTERPSLQLSRRGGAVAIVPARPAVAPYAAAVRTGRTVALSARGLAQASGGRGVGVSFPGFRRRRALDLHFVSAPRQVMTGAASNRAGWKRRRTRHNARRY
jgi:hypothetical protein